MGSDIRAITADELPAWLAAVHIGLYNPAARDADPEFRRPFYADTIAAGRVVAGFDGDRVVGTFVTYSTTCSVPGGGLVPMGAVSAVSVQPTHRRRGLLTRMMADSLRRSAEIGECVSILIPAEYPIYGRFGYGPATQQATLTIDARDYAVARPLPGTVELVTPEQWAEEMPAVHERVRAASAGSIERLPWWWLREAGLLTPDGRPDTNDKLFAVYRDDSGTPRGYALYHLADRPEDWANGRPRQRLTGKVMAEGPIARARLVQFLCEHDWVGHVDIDRQPVDDSWRLLLTDPRVVAETARYDTLWARVLDVPAALSQRTYEGSGRLVLAIRDEDGYAEGVYALEAGPDGVSCERTTESPDLAMPVQTLGSLYFGNHSATAHSRVGLLTEERPGAATLADLMFKTAIPPFMATWF